MSDEISPTDKVGHVVMDPLWRVATVQFDSASLILLSIRHPIHGDIHAMLPRSEAALMRDALIRVTAT